jgi:hypothetical protein
MRVLSFFALLPRFGKKIPNGRQALYNIMINLFETALTLYLLFSVVCNIIFVFSSFKKKLELAFSVFIVVLFPFYLNCSKFISA